MTMYDAERSRLELLRYLEQRRRNPKFDMFGVAIPEMTITLAELIDSHFMDYGQIICPPLEQFEQEKLIEIRQRPLRAINWRPTIHDRVDGDNAYVLHVLPAFHEVLLEEFYGKQRSEGSSREAKFKPYFDAKTGEFHFAADRKPLNFRRDSSPFKLFKTLWEKRPDEVGAAECGLKKTDFDIALHRMTQRSRNKFSYVLPIKSAGSNKKFFLDIPRD